MSSTTVPVDARALRDVFGHFPSGVAALAATVDGQDHVFVASSFTVGVSLEPPLVMFAVQRGSLTWPIIQGSATIGVSVLGHGQGTLCRQLAGRDKAARFTDVAVQRSDTGAILLDEAAVTLTCRFYAQYPGGDHDIIVLEVLSSAAHAHIDPLVFHGSNFRRLEVAA